MRVRSLGPSMCLHRGFLCPSVVQEQDNVTTQQHHATGHRPWPDSAEQLQLCPLLVPEVPGVHLAGVTDL